GAGGIGCAVGHALASAGVAVTFVEADPAKVDRGRAEGVVVEGLPPRPARFETFAAWEPPTDVPVLLCTKTYDNPAVLARLPPGPPLVPIQKGFAPALLARAPHVEGVASFVSECAPHRPHPRIPRRGKLHLGVHGPAREPLRTLACALADRLRAAPFRV